MALSADAEGKPIEEVYKRYHDGFLDLFQQVGISFDLFTTTHTSNHFKVSQSMFLALLKNGFLYPETRPQWYSPASKRFLPDRYVEGTCYICGFEGARSDQCDKCGSVLEPEKLLNPRSKIDGSTPELRDTQHYFLDLSKLEPEVAKFLRERQSYWRDTVINQSLGQIESEGLRARSITRDLDWGIPVPVDGWEGKVLYVWFEAVIGYLSASIEWAHLSGAPVDWKRWWTDPKAKAFYFVGKDNVFFHAAWWPAQLLGVSEQFMEIFAGESGQPLTLPYDLPANQFMNLEGQKISGSRNWAVWGRDFLSRYDPDSLRYYLTTNMPEMRDTDWDWDDFFHRNNDELVATWGNLANRVLSFAVRNFDGKVPDPGPLTELDEALLRTVEGGFDAVGAELDAVRLRSALGEAMRLATEVNRYLDQTAPWKEIKVDRQAAARSVYTALRCIDSLSVLLAPFLPHTCEKLHGFFAYQTPLFGTVGTSMVSDDLGTHNVLRYDPAGSTARWEPSRLQPGSPLVQPLPLFKKLDVSIVAEERARLGTIH